MRRLEEPRADAVAGAGRRGRVFGNGKGGRLRELSDGENTQRRDFGDLCWRNIRSVPRNYTMCSGIPERFKSSWSKNIRTPKSAISVAQVAVASTSKRARRFLRSFRGSQDSRH